MLKHAFLMMAYKQPELIERIIKHIEAENHYIYIHYDAKSKDFNKILELCDKYINVFVTTRKRISWGGSSQVSCQIDRFYEILNAENNYDYFHLISGQDYICVNNTDFDEFFEKNDGKSYMKLDCPEDVFEWRQNKFRYRLENYFFNDVKILDFNILGTKAYRYVNKLFRFIPRPYKEMDKIWGGGIGSHFIEMHSSM